MTSIVQSEPSILTDALQVLLYDLDSFLGNLDSLVGSLELVLNHGERPGQSEVSIQVT